MPSSRTQGQGREDLDDRQVTGPMMRLVDSSVNTVSGVEKGAHDVEQHHAPRRSLRSSNTVDGSAGFQPRCGFFKDDVCYHCAGQEPYIEHHYQDHASYTARQQQNMSTPARTTANGGLATNNRLTPAQQATQQLHSATQYHTTYPASQPTYNITDARNLSTSATQDATAGGQTYIRARQEVSMRHLVDKVIELQNQVAILQMQLEQALAGNLRP